MNDPVMPGSPDWINDLDTMEAKFTAGSFAHEVTQASNGILRIAKALTEIGAANNPREGWELAVLYATAHSLRRLTQ